MLAGMQAHNADMNLGPLVWIMPGNRDPKSFFEEVSDDAEFAAGACDLRGIIKKAPKYDEGSD